MVGCLIHSVLMNSEDGKGKRVEGSSMDGVVVHQYRRKNNHIRPLDADDHTLLRVGSGSKHPSQLDILE